MSAVLKRQQFECSETNKMESSISKYLRLDVNNNKKKQGLDKYESKDEDKRYIFFLLLFIFFLLEGSQTA